MLTIWNYVQYLLENDLLSQYNLSIKTIANIKIQDVSTRFLFIS